MGYGKYKVRLNRKRQDAIAELMAIGYDRNEAMEILDSNSFLMTEQEKEFSGFRKCAEGIEDGDE